MQAKYLNIAVLLCVCASTAFSPEDLQNRKPYAAGRFYTGNPDELRAQLQQLFSKSVRKKSENTPLAIIVPHAGYVFSGEVAASAFRQIDPDRKFERIFIIGSSHTTTFQGASVYCNGDFATPLGPVQVDLDLSKKLVRENEIIVNNPEAHQYEHSIEVQLPFLQYYMHTAFKIVPVVIGSSTKETAKKLADVFKPYLNENNLFVISSDFSHYPDYEDARKTDQLTAEAIKTNKPSTLLNVLEANMRKKVSGLATSLCGWSSVLTLLYMTEPMPDIHVDLIDYKNSGDSSYGEKGRVVGYWAVSFSNGTAKNQTREFFLNETDKKYLLNLARETITEYVQKGTITEIDPTGLSTVLRTPCGVFVTLNKHHTLRGCIGRFEPSLPLWSVVQKMAISASTQDYRFSKVQPNELSQLKIEISVLTPLKKIKSPEEIILGKHGIYIKKGNSSGTFLPQVATQTGWNKEEFLGHCSRDKAGLSWTDWKTAELYTYEALVFGEEE